MAPDDRCPMALHSFFSECLSRYTRGKGNPLSPFCGSGALNDTDGRPLAPVARQVRPVELGLSPQAHGCDRGGWRCRMAYLQADPDRSAVRLDSAVMRAHVSAAGTPPNPGTDHALGRSRGGFGTQIHGLADRRGRPLRVTGGPRHDRTQARARVEAWTDTPRPCLMADRAYNGDGFRAWRAPRGAEAVLPARKGRTPSQPHNPNGTRRVTPSKGASAGSNKDAAWPPAMPHTPIGAWVFGTGPGPGSGCNPTSTRPSPEYPARDAVPRGLGWLKPWRRGPLITTNASIAAWLFVPAGPGLR